MFSYKTRNRILLIETIEEKLTVQYGKEILTIVKLNRDLKTN